MKLARLLVDGSETSAENYTATKGSTIVEFKPAFLDSLAAGSHTVTAVWKDGTTTDASFAVDDKGQGGQTGGKTDASSSDGTKGDSVTNEKDDGRASAENPRRATGDKSKLAATGDSTWIVNIVLATAAAVCFMAARRLRSKAAWRE